MKQINQLVHMTKSFESLKSILKDGIHTSYNLEIFCAENILVPMISFSNILYRDIGEKEVVEYGSYAVVVERDNFSKIFDLNPVSYFQENSTIAKGIKYNYENALIPQILDDVKKFYLDTKGCCGTYLQNIAIKPLSEDAKSLINSIDENTSDSIINAYKRIFEKIFINSRNQILTSKPFKVNDKIGKEWIAYNEREWRKSYFDLNYIREFTPKGFINSKYDEIIKSRKPHLKEKEYSLQIPLSEIRNIIVTSTEEIQELRNFINFDLNKEIDCKLISTLENLKKIESFK
ncbi:MAG: hypothetical protein HYU67_06815 [Flavobacteriia bacterium]|nr:hypothetical protein [Flavobacteriia bacterium]